MMLIFVSTTYTLLSEDFDGVTPPSLPVGWYVVDGNSDGFTWRTYDNTATADSLSCGNSDLHGFFTSKYACYDDDDAGSSAPTGDDDLATPMIRINQHGTPNAVRLIYTFAYEDVGNPEDTFYVFVRLFDSSGTTVVPVAYYYDVPDVSGAPDTSGVDTIDLTGLTAGKDSMIVFFTYRDNPGSADWGWGAAVDNVVVEVDVTTTEVAESPVRLNGRTVRAESGEIYDVSGRLVGTFRGKYTFREPGVFFVKTQRGVRRVIVR